MAAYLAGMVVVGAWLATSSIADPASTAYFEAKGLEPWSVKAGVLMLAILWPLAVVLLARQTLRQR